MQSDIWCADSRTIASLRSIFVVVIKNGAVVRLVRQIVNFSGTKAFSLVPSVEFHVTISHSTSSYTLPTNLECVKQNCSQSTIANESR